MAKTEKVEEVAKVNGGKREGSGRKAGVPNKMSTTVKENVVAVFEELGGTDHMKMWAIDNPSQFYSIYAKLLPTDVNNNVTGNTNMNLTVTLVKAVVK